MVNEQATQVHRSWEEFQDKMARPGAISSSNGTDLEFLMLTLGVYEWIASFKKANIFQDPKELLGFGDGLKLALEGGVKSSFGSIRQFVLAIKCLENGDGIPVFATAPVGPNNQEGANPTLWDVEAVAKHFTEIHMESAALACKSHEISGVVLLEMTQEDISSGNTVKFENLGDLRRFKQAIEDLRKLADSAPLHAPGQASQNIAKLSGAVVAALTSSHGPPAEFPIDFLRRCTLGFDDNTRLEGEGAFGKVPYHFLLYFLVLLHLL